MANWTHLAVRDFSDLSVQQVTVIFKKWIQAAECNYKIQTLTYCDVRTLKQPKKWFPCFIDRDDQQEQLSIYHIHLLWPLILRIRWQWDKLWDYSEPWQANRETFTITQHARLWTVKPRCSPVGILQHFSCLEQFLVPPSQVFTRAQSAVMVNRD